MTKFAERKKKWGEEMVFKSLSLPENIIEKLKLLRELYKDNYGRPVSYGEIFERLLSSLALGMIDPAIYAQFIKQIQNDKGYDEVVTRNTTKKETNNYDPADPEMEPWNLRYFYLRDGEEVDAIPGNSSPFYAVINGRNIGYRQMRHDGWILTNEVGAVIDYDTAWAINNAIKQRDIKK